MKLVITQNITLDGVIEAVGDWFSFDLEPVLRRMIYDHAAFLSR